MCVVLRRLIARALPTLFGDTGELNSCESDVQPNEDIDVCQPRSDGDVALGDDDGYGIENIGKLLSIVHVVLH